jgi:hypothetical protein
LNWYEYNKKEWSLHSDIAILNDAELVLLNDENLKPNWIEHPAMFTEFHVKRNSENLVLVIGESWTYGEALPEIATAIRKYNLLSQLKYSFGPKLAVTLNADYYQYAVPGNCNYYMFEELKRILSHVRQFNYKKIYLCMQMTEPSREKSILHEIINHPVELLYREKISFKDWLIKYDEIFLTQFNQTLKEKSDLNIDPILWKNFCRINYQSSDFIFKSIETTWIQYSSRMLGMNLEQPMFYSVDWVANMYENYKNLNYNKTFILEETDKIEKSNNFLKANVLHSHHPNQFSHLLWSQFIARKSGWVDGI